MTHEQFIELLRAAVDEAITELEGDRDQMLELRSGRLRLTINQHGVCKERLVPKLALVAERLEASPSSRL